ncbi:hypothetical protein NMG60_11011976 [Bertholletia excelsa]
MADRCRPRWPEEAAWTATPKIAASIPPPWTPSCGYPAVAASFSGAEEDKAVSASKSHSQAEKRRRDRINSQLATLRKLIPKSDKMDKAALLGSAVEHLKDLKRKAAEVSRDLTIPTDVDEVSIDSYKHNEVEDDKDVLFIKASLCCDDRPDLFAELIEALRGLRLTTVKADMASLGGRIKGIFVLCVQNSEEGGASNDVVQALKGVFSRIIASSSSAPGYQIKSKRQRFFLPPCDHVW